MLTSCYRCRGLLAFLALALAAQSSVQAAGWYDDFNDGSATDGNPVTWQSNASGYFPNGVLNASTGDYVLSSPDDGDDNSVIEASVNMNFTDTYVRTQAVVMPGEQPEQIGGTLGVWARYDPATVTGYLAILSNEVGRVELLRIDPGVDIVTLDELGGLDIDTNSDAMIELNVVGDQLSVYLWRPEDPKPSEPTVTAIDSTYTSGRAGILHNENNENTLGVFRFAAAQDTPFVDGVAGDFDGDNYVDGADFLDWQRGGSPAPLSAADLATWKANFGAAPPVATAIPEPTTLAMALGLFGLVAGGRRRNHSKVA